jgi:hypothetical protein
MACTSGLLGVDIDQQKAYSRLGLYRADTEQIDGDLKERLGRAQIVDGLFQIA